MSRDTNPADHEELRDLCAAYALGVLDPSESTRFEEHLREECEVCRSEITEHRRTVAALGSLLEEKTPPADAEERLIARLAAKDSDGKLSTVARPTRVAGGWLPWLTAAAALLFAVPSLWIAVESRREVTRLQRDLLAVESTTDSLVSVYDLKPAPTAGRARARATFDPRTRTWRLFVHDLIAPPEGMTYQGWLVTRDGPHDFGTFLPDETGHGHLALRLSDDPSGARVRVTLEPAGGSDRPSGSLVFASQGDELLPE